MFKVAIPKVFCNWNSSTIFFAGTFCQKIQCTSQQYFTNLLQFKGSNFMLNILWAKQKRKEEKRLIQRTWKGVVVWWEQPVVRVVPFLWIGNSSFWEKGGDSQDREKCDNRLFQSMQKGQVHSNQHYNPVNNKNRNFFWYGSVGLLCVFTAKHFWNGNIM